MSSEHKILISKPCPCCGSSDIEDTVAPLLPEQTVWEACLECRECGLSITRTSKINHVEAWKSVMVAWNRRYAEDLQNGLELPAPEAYIAPLALLQFKASQPKLDKEWCWNLPDNDLIGVYSIQTILSLFPGTKEHKP